VISWGGTYLAEFITKRAKSWLQGTNLARQWLGLVISYVSNWICASLCFPDGNTWLLKHRVQFSILAGQNSEIIWCLGKSMEKCLPLSAVIKALCWFSTYSLWKYTNKRFLCTKSNMGRVVFFALYITPVCIQSVLV